MRSKIKNSVLFLLSLIFLLPALLMAYITYYDWTLSGSVVSIGTSIVLFILSGLMLYKISQTIYRASQKIKEKIGGQKNEDMVQQNRSGR